MIYFDNASSTRPSDEVLSEFEKCSKLSFANPGAIHRLGVTNATTIQRIKNDILKVLNLKSTEYEVIFTGGATESNNLAIQGFLNRNAKRFNHILTSTIEHPSVLEVFKYLETKGFKVDYIKVNNEGVLDLVDLKNHLDGKPVFCSFMGTNNEVGTTNNLKEIRKIIGEDSVLHSDLTQSIGKAKVDFSSTDLFSFTGHKIYGLKGCGCLIKKKKVFINPIVYGGNQENGLRSGTPDYPSISALNVALKNVINDFSKEDEKLRTIRCYLVSELVKIEGVKLHDYPTSCNCIVSLSLLNKKASVVVEALSNKEIYVSSVSACNSKGEPMSYVVYEITGSELEAKNTIRISLGKYNTLDEAKVFINEFKDVLSSIRS